MCVNVVKCYVMSHSLVGWRGGFEFEEHGSAASGAGYGTEADLQATLCGLGAVGDEGGVSCACLIVF